MSVSFKEDVVGIISNPMINQSVMKRFDEILRSSVSVGIDKPRLFGSGFKFQTSISEEAIRASDIEYCVENIIENSAREVGKAINWNCSGCQYATGRVDAQKNPMTWTTDVLFRVGCKKNDNMVCPDLSIVANPFVVAHEPYVSDKDVKVEIEKLDERYGLF